MIAAYIDEIIMFFAGAWMMSAGFGWLPRLPNLAAREESCTHLTLANTIAKTVL